MKKLLGLILTCFSGLSAEAADISYSELPRPISNIFSTAVDPDGKLWLSVEYSPATNRFYRCSGRGDEVSAKLKCTMVEAAKYKPQFTSPVLLNQWKIYGEPQYEQFFSNDFNELNPPFKQTLIYTVMLSAEKKTVHLCKRIRTDYDYETLVRGHTVFIFSDREPVTRISCDQVYPRL